MLAQDNHLIQPALVVKFLKKTVKLKEVYQQIVHQQIVQEAAQKANIVVAPEEIQSEANLFRRKMRLEKAADTLAWLEDQMITPEEWEAGLNDQLLAQKLARHLFEEEARKHFYQNQINFDKVLLYRIVIPYERLAWEVFYQIEEEEMSFYQAAHLYDIDEKRRTNCGYEGKLPRWSIPPDLAPQIFAATPKQVNPPIYSDRGIEKGYHILMVEEFIPAELTPQIHQEIIDQMFQDWLNAELNHWLHNS